MYRIGEKLQEYIPYAIAKGVVANKTWKYYKETSTETAKYKKRIRKLEKIFFWTILCIYV